MEKEIPKEKNTIEGFRENEEILAGACLKGHEPTKELE